MFSQFGRLSVQDCWAKSFYFNLRLADATVGPSDNHTRREEQSQPGNTRQNQVNPKRPSPTIFD